jgi:hypothetical protein
VTSYEIINDNKWFFWVFCEVTEYFITNPCPHFVRSGTSHKIIIFQTAKSPDKPKRCIKNAVRIPPHPALSPRIGGEGKGEGEIRDEDGIHRR